MTARDEFAKSVIASGLMSAEDLQTFWQKIPATQRPKDGETLGAVLVQNSRLTDYQKQELLAGRGKGLVLGNYVILDKLGQGGMGMVLKAEHKRMKRVVALKVLAPHVTKSPEALRRFQREVEAVAKLDHPNIVGAHDADEANGTHFLVMEYVEGRDLASIARSQGPLSPGDAVRCMLQAARGLEYAHGKGIIHRDIKPHNLMLDGQGTVKILDMGLARLESAGGEQDQLTGTGQIMGTVDFMAPEQAMDTRNADARADMYALGATLWYLIVGRPMYAGETMLQKLIAHQQAPIPSLCEVRSDVTPALEAVFTRMVAKTPDERYASMRELIADLERSLIDTSHAATMMFDGATAGHSPQSLAMSIHSAAAGTAAAPSVAAPPVVAPASLHDATVDVSRPDLETHPKVEPAWSVPVVTPASRRARSASPPPRSAKLMIGVGVGSVGLVAAVLVATLSLTGGDARKDPNAVAKNTPNRQSAPLSTKAAKGTPPPLAIAPFDADAAKKHQEAWATYLGVPVEFTNSIGMKFRLIPPGEFTMGMAKEEADSIAEGVGDGNVKSLWLGSSPAHRVRITQPYYLGVCEVTQAQYEKIMGVNPSFFSAGRASNDNIKDKDTSKHPVESISPAVAASFCDKLSLEENLEPAVFNQEDTVTLVSGNGYRLPTEAQWEWACRAGTQSSWSHGDREDTLQSVAWYGNANGSTHRVGELKPNPFGLYDIHGNVWELCRDYFNSQEYLKRMDGITKDPQCLGINDRRNILRGGSFGHGSLNCRSDFRGASYAAIGHPGGHGFRVLVGVSAARSLANVSDAKVTPETVSFGAPTKSPIAAAPPLAIVPFDAAKAKEHQQTWAKYLGTTVEKEIELPGGVKLVMVLIPPGEFMRSEDGGKTSFRVRLTKPFFMGKYEVTQEQWQAVMGNNPSNFKDSPTLPVESVSWDDIQPLLAKLNTGGTNGPWRFDLPTEAQWEYACRAGTTSANSFGDSDADVSQYAWINGNAADKTHLVGRLKANPFGLHDVHGNVWEYCVDWWDDAYYARAPQEDPRGPSGGSLRVFRGGGWDCVAAYCRSAFRVGNGPSIRGNNFGFRLALSFVGVRGAAEQQGNK